MSQSDFNFVTSVLTRWGDADMLGHINNVIFIRYLESGTPSGKIGSGDESESNLQFQF